MYGTINTYGKCVPCKKKIVLPFSVQFSLETFFLMINIECGAFKVCMDQLHNCDTFDNRKTSFLSRRYPSQRAQTVRTSDMIWHRYAHALFKIRQQYEQSALVHQLADTFDADQRAGIHAGLHVKCPPFISSRNQNWNKPASFSDPPRNVQFSWKSPTVLQELLYVRLAHLVSYLGTIFPYLDYAGRWKRHCPKVRDTLRSQLANIYFPRVKELFMLQLVRRSHSQSVA